MGSQITHKLLTFVKDVKKLAPNTDPVLIRVGAKPFEMTLYEFVVLWYDKAITVIKEGELHPMQDVICVLKKEHSNQVLNALLKEDIVPLKVLREYRFRSELYKPIRKYCRVRKIDLDA